jgi:peptide deformylase
VKYTLQTEGAESLFLKSSEWDFENPPEDSKLVEAELTHYIETLGGAGFAANQMGFMYRVMAIDLGHRIEFFYNPTLVTKGEETTLVTEGCLSFPGLFIKVRRPNLIIASWQDRLGGSHTQELTGMTSRCYQHELDHLDGICYTDRVSKLSLDMAKKKRTKRERNQ